MIFVRFGERLDDQVRMFDLYHRPRWARRRRPAQRRGAAVDGTGTGPHGAMAVVTVRQTPTAARTRSVSAQRTDSGLGPSRSGVAAVEVIA